MIENEIRFDTSTLREDRVEELLGWVKALGVELADVRSKGVIVSAEQEYELHLSRFIRSKAGRIRIDRAAEQPVTEPLIVPLGTVKNWPTWLDAPQTGDVTVNYFPAASSASSTDLARQLLARTRRLGAYS